VTRRSRLLPASRERPRGGAAVSGLMPLTKSKEARSLSALLWELGNQRIASCGMAGRYVIRPLKREHDGMARPVAVVSGWITAQMMTVDCGRMDYIGHG
jgi:hypothetical protein